MTECNKACTEVSCLIFEELHIACFSKVCDCQRWTDTAFAYCHI